MTMEVSPFRNERRSHTPPMRTERKSLPRISRERIQHPDDQVREFASDSDAFDHFVKLKTLKLMDQLPDWRKTHTRETVEATRVPGKRLKTDGDPTHLKQLRDEARVGRQAYGAGLVNSYQKHIRNDDAFMQERAQEGAMRELEEKIRQGVVDPGAIGAEIIDLLEVSTDIPVIPEQLEQTEADQEILLTVFDEVDQCLKKELIAPTEAFLVKAESVRFLELYRAGYPSMSHTTCLELVRDNARKIVYQTARDKEVFSGSDHGTRHIIEGNIKFADQLTNSLEKQLGHPLSARDKVLIHQAIIDHDCGYSCGCAQAKRGFEASKDHPLFSTKFIDANMDYYREKFGAKGASTIRTAVLYHSYPISDYRIESSEDTAVNPNIVRSVMSTVDSLGVTAETKTPAFFRKPEAIRVLLRLQLALETSPEKDAKGSRVLSEHALNAFKNELSHVAEQEPNARRREGFTRSINDFFSEYTAKTTLGHYTGLVKHVGVEQLPNGSIVPKVEMSMSRIHALLGNMFGGAMETEAFVKTMQTFGLTKQSTERLGKTLEAQRKNKAATGETIKIENERAVFEISTNLSDAEARDFPAVLDVVQEAYALSVRLDVQETIHTLRKQPEQADKIAGHLGEKMMGLFLESNDPRLDSDDIQRLHNILQHISDDPSEEHIRALETFTTNKERAYISLPSPTL